MPKKTKADLEAELSCANEKIEELRDLIARIATDYDNESVEKAKRIASEHEEEEREKGWDRVRDVMRERDVTRGHAYQAVIQVAVTTDIVPAWIGTGNDIKGVMQALVADLVYAFTEQVEYMEFCEYLSNEAAQLHNPALGSLLNRMVAASGFERDDSLEIDCWDAINEQIWSDVSSNLKFQVVSTNVTHV